METWRPEFSLQHPGKRPGVAAHAWNPGTEKAETGWAPWLANLAESVSPRPRGESLVTKTKVDISEE